MCLAVPGKVISVSASESETGRTAVVDLQGNRVETSLALTPEAGEGDWVLMHAGFAIEVIDEDHAREIWQYLNEAMAPESSAPAAQQDQP
ncbi:MAG: HypC/HybG/HupF family hydrogenase formation chaperone [Phycisphaerae bacterium]|nr:HypC/HybG/HupF family hydrogenase formation chaperone [Phycisphaerae bacterium]